MWHVRKALGGPVSICRESSPAELSSSWNAQSRVLDPLSSERASWILEASVHGPEPLQAAQGLGPERWGSGVTNAGPCPSGGSQGRSRKPVCVCVLGEGWKGCQAASPGSAQVPPGCPRRLACLNLGPGELVFPPRVAKGSKTSR